MLQIWAMDCERPMCLPNSEVLTKDTWVALWELYDPSFLFCIFPFNLIQDITVPAAVPQLKTGAMPNCWSARLFQ